ncbi:MAG: L-2-hydroxyglutarate oxidase [Planctomycetales bacterium]|nr:L-2-hydroxyglutarate oxidase [Planctomycetales bacterium]
MNDFVIVGGGIVGLTTAWELIGRFPAARIVVLEKEPQVAHHQTGHNSGVLHSGIYYRPGSLKARLCREGKARMEAFCAEHSVPFERCGKVIVAVDESELGRLDNILERGQANGVDCERIGRERLSELEPHCAGIAAIHVPEAGIVSYRAVAQKLAQLLPTRGEARVVTSARVTGFRSDGSATVVASTQGEFEARQVINCGGLQTDRVSRLGGVDPGARIVPFRGEYYELVSEQRHLCRNLIYPVPDPAFPFLGVHFTRMIDGSVECGPNAVLAFSREGYRMGSIRLRDLWESITYSGFLRLASRHWRMGMGELWRSFSKAAFVRALRRLMPSLEASYLRPAAAGVRAQAVEPDGRMVDDFLFRDRAGFLSVVNAPSPAATASLAIAREICDRLP